MIAVLGDIHGCFFTLKALYEKIVKKYPDIQIFSVGDIIDRGKFSFECFEFVKDNNISFVKGNHDLMMYHYILEDENDFAECWTFNNPFPTLDSYSQHHNEWQRHLKLIERAPFYYDLPDAFISHAGISLYFKGLVTKEVLEDKNLLDNLVELHASENYGIVWTRHKLLNIGKLQIVGHTPQMIVNQDPDSNTLYIDTGVYLEDRFLSAVIIEDNKMIDQINQDTVRKDIP